MTSESGFLALAGTTNRFQGAVTNNAGASFSGPGWAVFEVTLIVQSAVAADNLELRGAGLQGPGSLSVANNFRWLGGQIKAPLSIGAGGHAVMPPNPVSGTSISGATVLNSGTWDWQAGALSGDLGAMFLNDGTFVMHHNGSFERTVFGSGAAPVFVNRAMGTFIKTNDVANGQGIFRAGFNNLGTAKIGPNGITLLGGGTNSGTLMVTDTLEFDANYVLDDSSIVNGNGVLRFFLGTVTIAGMYNLDGLTFVDGGTAAFNILNASGATSGNAAISGGTLAANGPFSVRTNLNWYGGTIAGTNAVTVPTAGKLNVASNSTHFINGGATLNNDGTGMWTDNGPIQFSGSGGIFNNRHNGTFEAHNSAPINGNGIVNNSGTYLKTASGVSLVNSSVKFNNANSVQVQMGAFQLSGGGTNSGTFDVSANATNEFSGGSYYFVGGNTLSGAGWSRIVNATLTVSNSLGAQNFEVNGGTVNGPGAFSLSGQLIWDAGATISPASTELGPFSQTLLTNTGVKSWSGFITNKGAVTWSGAGNLDSGAGTLFGNAGTFAIVNGANWTAPSGMAFFNSGLFKKALDTNISGLRLWFTNAGTLDAASGTMDFTSGSYLGLSNSVLMGVGTVKGNFPQFGGTRPGESPGALQVIGNFLQTNSSLLEVEIGGTSAGTNYDQLNVSGGATLGGMLNIILTNGFSPALGDSFLILTCATRTNKFAALNGAHLSNGLLLAPIYSNTNVLLKTFAEFSMQAPMRNGTNFTFTFNSASGLSYVVQYADLMPAPAWHTLTNFVGDGNLKTVLDSPDLSVMQRYYRICTQ
ncbi:MAG TPA: hypothetical protein VGE41_11715 [Verrucomicrobiae bacterium]